MGVEFGTAKDLGVRRCDFFLFFVSSCRSLVIVQWSLSHVCFVLFFFFVIREPAGSYTEDDDPKVKPVIRREFELGCLVRLQG